MENKHHKHIHHLAILLVIFDLVVFFCIKVTSSEANVDRQMASTIQVQPKIKNAARAKVPLDLSHAVRENDILRQKDGQVLVKFNKKNPTQKKLFLQKNKNYSPMAASKTGQAENNIGMIQIGSEDSVDKKINDIRKESIIAAAQPNYVYFPAKIKTNDTLAKVLWGLDNSGAAVLGKKGKPGADIDGPESWNLAKNAKKITVAVIDTGVAYAHPDLSGSMWNGEKCVDEAGNPLGGCSHGFDFTTGSKDPLPDESAHGTAVTGVISARRGNGRGVIGEADNAEIMSLKTDFSSLELVQAIGFAQKNGAKIINASWGASVASCQEMGDGLLYQAIKSFPGLIVAAAGNDSRQLDGRNNFFFPADFSHDTECWEALPNVISVGATDQNDELSSFSDFGDQMVDIGAPGENIATTYASFGVPGEKANGSDELYAYLSGTSLAAPQVSAIAAVIWGMKKDLSPEDVKKIILESGDGRPNLQNKFVSGKRVNALRALQRLGDADKIANADVLKDVQIEGAGSIETSPSLTAKIVVNYPSPAALMKLSRSKNFKKSKWFPASGEIPVKLKKNRKTQNFYMIFRDADGGQSPIYKKSFRYRRIK